MVSSTPGSVSTDHARPEYQSTMIDLLKLFLLTYDRDRHYGIKRQGDCGSSALVQQCRRPTLIARGRKIRDNAI